MFIFSTLILEGQFRSSNICPYHSVLYHTVSPNFSLSVHLPRVLGAYMHRALNCAQISGWSQCTITIAIYYSNSISITAS